MQNVLLVAASYYFYANWDYRFLSLLLFSTLLDYFTGIQIFKKKSTKYKQIWLWVSIGINLGFLGIFKYYNFFIDSFIDFCSMIGFRVHLETISVVLPVGISFYTFHGLSYVIDIYNNKIKPERNFINYALFVTFFPLLVAGPIERATHLLPQLKVKRIFDYNKSVDGLRQILWGLFKKIAIADFAAVYVNMIFNNSDQYGGTTLILGAVLFAFQIYCDFSGYSDIAIGTAKLFGIDLLRNFAFPFFSRDIAEFWRRWHISLSSWFKDYVYIPLGGSKGGYFIQIRNILIIFLLSGFWHGANWTFISWGVLNALYFIPLLLLKQNRNHIEIVATDRLLPSIRETFQIFITFTLCTLAWIFFRAENMTHALRYILKIFTSSLLSLPEIMPFSLLLLIGILIIIEWVGRKDQFALASIGRSWPTIFRWGMYYAIILVAIKYSGNEQTFIYFQF